MSPVISAPEPYACAPGSYSFGNNSQGANFFLWDFGDGTTSTEFEPSHLYTTPGTYTVTLLGQDTSGCLAPDTTSFILNVFASGTGTISSFSDTICPSDTVQLEATGGGSYTWLTTSNISNTTIANPIVYPTSTATY